MITDLYMAAVTGAPRSLPFTPPTDQDIVAVRKLLSVDAAVPASYVPLIRLIGAFSYVTAGLPFPVPPPTTAPEPSVTMNGAPVTPAWTSAKPPTFVYKPSRLPLATVWTLTKIDAATALLTSNIGQSWTIACHQASDFTVVPAWPEEVGSDMGIALSGAWSYPIVFSIPPTCYPFDYADKQTAYATPVQRLLFATGDVNLHASLVRPAERLAVVAAALVKKFLMQAVNISDGSTASWQLMPRILTWYGEALELNPNLLAFRG